MSAVIVSLSALGYLTMDLVKLASTKTIQCIMAKQTFTLVLVLIYKVIFVTI